MLKKVFLYVTNRCNASCSHCVTEAGKTRENELVTAEILKVLEECAALGARRIALTGGEPTLHADILKIIAHGSCQGLIMSIETNGSTLTPEYVVKMKDAGLSILNVSLDSALPSVHNSMRNIAGLFERVVNMVMYAAQQGLDVRVWCATSMWNIETALDVPRLFSQVPHVLCGFGYCMPLGRGALHPELAVSPRRWRTFCQSLTEKYRNEPVRIRYQPVFLSPSEMEQMESGDESPHDPRCYAYQRSSLYIWPNGDVYGCVLLSGTRIVLGNVRNQSLSEIYHDSASWNFFKKNGCAAYNLPGTEWASLCPLILYYPQEGELSLMEGWRSL